eukprot:104118_1
MAEFDLTFTLSKYLDKHLILPLLSWQLDKDDPIYSRKSLQEAQLEIVKKTNMTDFAVELYSEIHDTEEIPAELQKRAEAIDNTVSDKINELDSLYDKLCSSDRSQITAEILARFRSLIEFRFDCGQYGDSTIKFLQFYRAHAPTEQARMSTGWGALSACVLAAQWANEGEQDWESALEAFRDLQDSLRVFIGADQLTLLTHRNWLIHWSLFVFYNHPEGHVQAIDFLSEDDYMSAIQTTCPHILRYLAVSLVVVQKRTALMTKVALIINEEKDNYSDPITEFLRLLLVEYDFEAAEKMLSECGSVLDNDFFLSFYKEEFIRSAQLLFFKTFCSVHRRVDYKDLAVRLNIQTDQQPEEWAVSLIEKLSLNAKIDAKNDHIVMTPEVPNVYERVISKTKAIDIRVDDILGQLRRKYDKRGA